MRRCMALLAASARALLQDLLRWQAPKHADVARQCAEHLSHLHEDIAERKVLSPPHNGRQSWPHTSIAANKHRCSGLVACSNHGVFKLPLHKMNAYLAGKL